MQPEQPYSSPYDFITNPGAPQKRPMLAGGGLPGKGTMLAVGAGVVVIVLIILAVALSGGGSEPAATAVAQDQAELVHLSGIANQNAGSIQQPTANFAQTCSLSAASAEAQLTQLLAQAGTKLSASQLAFKQSAAADQELNQAVNSSTFDQTFLTVMQSQLSGYAADLKQAYAGTQSAALRQLLNRDYQDAQLLSKQLTSTQSQVQAGSS